MPRDAANYVLAQVDETKHGLFRVVAKEVREFPEHTNIANEMQKMLTTVQFEISTTIRFKPNEGPADSLKLPKPEVRADVQMKRAGARPNARTTRPCPTPRTRIVPATAAEIESEYGTEHAETSTCRG